MNNPLSLKLQRARKILVTGGAGYIGSFTVRALKEEGFEPIVFDSLETGHPESIPGVKIYQGNLLSDLDLLEKVFREEKPEGVVHFAAYIEVGESVQNPQKYFFNNVVGTLNLLKVVLKHKVPKFVFSSTAATYGDQDMDQIDEETPQEPTNPYGLSKLIVEKILRSYCQAYPFSAVALRYFNAAGASLDGNFGQDYPQATHLITSACEAFLGKRADFKVFGQDYPTKDGTGVRDYIHVLDLASAHVRALKSDLFGFNAFNVGTGNGFSVLEVLEMLKKVSGIDYKISFGPRRPGDQSQTVAKAKKIKKLGWEPKYSDLETIVKTAWLWHKNHPKGYKK
ncbi:MAG: UDP-glucose 4-epimerase GalE [bacterium]|nr:UDP-glucose 4-epimerase GalE [bacterium]